MGSEGSSKCNIESIANPDNVAWIAEDGNLIISEDSGNVENNQMWVWHPATNELTRVLNAPYGAEVTGVGQFKINGWEYWMANMQHPYGGMSNVNEPGEIGWLSDAGLVLA